ncbi:MAG: aldolase [Burkholderiaceae bacterium]
MSHVNTHADVNRAREAICEIGRSLFERGYTHGSTGNISVRHGDGYLMTPTGASLGRLDPARLSWLDERGRHIEGDKPTKESFLHTAVYERRAADGAVIHLHATHSTAVSILADVDPDDVLPPLTAYYVMRVGKLPLIPYFAPGDIALAEAVRERAGSHRAVLLANHGPVVAGTDLAAACDAIEELEATSRLYLLLRGAPLRLLDDSQVRVLRQRFGA